MSSRDDRRQEWKDDIERRIESLEARLAILSRAVGLASLREVDLLKHLGVSTEAVERDAAELRGLIEEDVEEEIETETGTESTR